MSRALRSLCAAVFLAAAYLVAPRPAGAVCTTVSPFCSATYTTTATATVTTTCWPGYPVVSSTNNYCYSIGTGANSASETNRTLKSGASAIQYQIYNEASFTRQCKLTDNAATPVCQATGPFPARQTQVLTKTLYAKILSYGLYLPPGTYTESYTGAQANVNYRGDTTAECGGHCNYTPFTLTLTLAPSCTVSATDMVFPARGFITSDVDATATIALVCTNTTPYVVNLSVGAGARANMFSRRMTGPGGNLLYYNLFTQPPALAWPLGETGLLCLLKMGFRAREPARRRGSPFTAACPRRRRPRRGSTRTRWWSQLPIEGTGPAHR